METKTKKILIIGPIDALLDEGLGMGGKDRVTLNAIDSYLENGVELYILPIKGSRILKDFDIKHNNSSVGVLRNRCSVIENVKFILSNLLRLVKFLVLSNDKSLFLAVVNGDIAALSRSLKYDIDVVHNFYTGSIFHETLDLWAHLQIPILAHIFHGAKAGDYSLIDLAIFPSKFEMDRTIKHTFYKDSAVISPCVDTLYAKPVVVATPRRYFCYIAIIEKRKRLHMLIIAMSKFPDIDLHIAGIEVDKNYLELCKKLSQGLDNIIWHGKVSDGEKVFLLSNDKCIGLTIPSENEAFGISYVEALCFGSPVLGFAPAIAEFTEICNMEVGIGVEQNASQLELELSLKSLCKLSSHFDKKNVTLKMREYLSYDVFSDKIIKTMLKYVNDK